MILCASYQPAGHDMYHRETNPGLAALRRFLVISTQAAELHEPTEGTLDDPAARQHGKSGMRIRALDDFQHPAPKGGSPGYELAGIPAIRPDEAPPRKGIFELLQDQLGPVAILNASAVPDHDQQQPQRIYDQMALAAFDLFAGIEAIVPPFCIVLTDCESIIAAEGVGSRPCWTRSFSRNTSCTRSMRPCFRQRQKWSQTSLYGGKSCGRERQAAPLRH